MDLFFVVRDPEEKLVAWVIGSSSLYPGGSCLCFFIGGRESDASGYSVSLPRLGLANGWATAGVDLLLRAFWMSLRRFSLPVNSTPDDDDDDDAC